jgi:hypothetical protein
MAREPRSARQPGPYRQGDVPVCLSGGSGPEGRGVKVLAKPLSSSTALSTVTDAVRQGQSFKAKIEHHSLEKRTTYLPKAFDDNQDPRAITSYEIKTT